MPQHRPFFYVLWHNSRRRQNIRHYLFPADGHDVHPIADIFFL